MCFFFLLSVSISVDSVRSVLLARSLTSITTVNGKTGIDNLLLVIYQRYFFFINIFYLFVFTLQVYYLVRNGSAATRVRGAQSANDDEVIFIIYFDQRDTHEYLSIHILYVYT